MKKNGYLLVAFFCVQFCCAQKTAYKIHTIAFYNLENLFDTIDEPDLLDEESPILKIQHNRAAIYQQKLRNMAKVLAEIGLEKNKDLPTIIGVVEVENKKVLEDLINTEPLKGKGYGIIHFDSPDLRGIDVALLYRENLFIPISYYPNELRIWNSAGFRIHTRDQLLVSGYLENELIHVIVNHWPSRRGGEKRSRPFREKAASLTKKISDSILEVNPKWKIIVMGDFNDDSTNSSFKKILQSHNEQHFLSECQFYNPFENLFQRGHNTLGYNDNLNLFDQILLSESLVSLKKDFTNLGFYQAHIYNPKYLTLHDGRYKGYPFRSFANGKFTNGFSDHYPVYVYLLKKDE